MTVTKKEKVEVIEINVYCCDLCGKTIEDNRGFCGTTPIMVCEICGRHCCKDCRVSHYDDFGDCPTAVYCKHCEGVYQENKHFLDDERYRHEEEEGKIQRFIKDEAIRTLTEECDLEDERV